ncbi:MAG: phosphoribosylanthranilate isomerase [Pseudomonadota bacterium]
MTEVKICGLSEPDTLAAAVAAGADYVGFNFFPKSPRYVDLELAVRLRPLAGPAKAVALLVDPSDDDLGAIEPLEFDVIQLHGAETPARLEQIKRATDLVVWKALGVETAEDLARAGAFDAADALLIDAKPPKGSDLPGGNGAPFDWSILAGWTPEKPWMLSGGLTPETVAAAIAATNAPAVDVASGVERSRGVKDPTLIKAFVTAAKAA